MSAPLVRISSPHPASPRRPPARMLKRQHGERLALARSRSRFSGGGCGERAPASPPRRHSRRVQRLLVEDRRFAFFAIVPDGHRLGG